MQRVPVQGTPLTPDLLHPAEALSAGAAGVPPARGRGISGCWWHIQTQILAGRDLQPGLGLGTGVVMVPSPAVPIPSQANSPIPSPVRFAQCLDPRLQRTYHGEKERGEGRAP